jgi:hypothetical protein
MTCQLDPYRFDMVMRSLPFAVAYVNLQYVGTPPLLAAGVGINNSGVQEGDCVLIAGATGPYAQSFNGVFRVFNVSPFSFFYTPIGNPLLPPGGNITCRLFQFDSARLPIPNSPPVAVRLGPGTLETAGSAPQQPTSWLPRSAMRIRGSSMGVSVLRLAGAAIDNGPNDFLAVGNSDNLIGFEAGDFCIDCNIGGQPSATTACGAIAVYGQHTRFRRLRCINFGSQVDPNLLFTECFVLASGGARPGGSFDTVDCVIQDCILEQPGQNNATTTTLIDLFSEDVNGIAGYHRACVIRNCFLDLEYRQNPVPISQITVDINGIATVTTSLPHGHANNDWVRISGVTVNGSTANSFNGSYQILSNSVTDNRTFKYTPSPAQPQGQLTAGDRWVGRFPSFDIPVSGVSNPSGTVITVTTSQPHFLIPGQTVYVNGIKADPLNPSPYNGVQRVLSNPSPTPFQFSYDPGTNPGITSILGAYIGVFIQGPGIHGGTAAVSEGNRVINCQYAGPYADTWTSRDQITRNCWLRATANGPRDLLGGRMTTAVAIPLKSLTIDVHSVVTAETYQPHGLTSVDSVVVSGVTGPTPDDVKAYNGKWTITNVPTPYKVNYTAGGTPSGQPLQGTPGYGTDDQQFLMGTLMYNLQGGIYVVTATVYLTYPPPYPQTPPPPATQTPQGHQLSVGDVVYISKVTAQTRNDYFNGYHVVTEVPDQSTFKFNLQGDPNPQSTSGSVPSGYFSRVWNAGRMAVENNMIDLLPTGAVGINLTRSSPATPLYPQVLLRRNVMRYVDGSTDAQKLGIGIAAAFCGSVLTEENVVDATYPAPVFYNTCNSAKFFANQTSAGQLIQGTQFDLNNKMIGTASELSTDVEDAVLALL